MAALTIADLLAETGLRIKRLEDELAGLQNARMEAISLDKAAHAAIAAALNAAAERIESIVKRLTASDERRQRRAGAVTTRSGATKQYRIRAADWIASRS